MDESMRTTLPGRLGGDSKRESGRLAGRCSTYGEAVVGRWIWLPWSIDVYGVDVLTNDIWQSYEQMKTEAIDGCCYQVSGSSWVEVA